MQSRWRPVWGYEGLYEVSSSGAVQSVERKVRTKGGAFKTVKSHTIISHVTHDGYERLSLHREGKVKMFTTHRLVADAFLGPSTAHVNHIDGVKRNNHWKNLERTTVALNQAPAARMGLLCRGEAQHNAKLTIQTVRSARALADVKMTLAQIRNALKLNISLTALNNAIRRVTWKHC